jgi:hypothetical protein
MNYFGLFRISSNFRYTIVKRILQLKHRIHWSKYWSICFHAYLTYHNQMSQGGKAQNCPSCGIPDFRQILLTRLRLDLNNSLTKDNHRFFLALLIQLAAVILSNFNFGTANIALIPCIFYREVNKSNCAFLVMSINTDLDDLI